MIRLFLADDMPAVREVLRAGLEGAAGRYAIAGEASDGQSALAAIAAVRPDIIILDVDMPGLDGLAVVRSLRSRGDATPVILCSSWGQDSRPLPDGVTACLQKPFRMEALVRAVAAAAAMLAPTE